MQAIQVFRHGFVLEHYDGGTLHAARSPECHSRGRVVCWSSKSRRRLRRALCEYCGVGECIGCTYTLPCDSLPEWFVCCLVYYILGFFRPDVVGFVMDCSNAYLFRQIVRRWSASLSYVGLAAIYRVELQCNGRPHLHAVSWVQSADHFIALYSSWVQALHSSFAWHSEYGLVSMDCFDGALLHAVHLQRVEFAGLGAYRYLCDHASKHKQAQLGWHGRQWGIVNRAALRSTNLCRWELTDDQYDRVLRLIRRLSHCRVSRGNGGRSVWFTRPDTLAKIVDFVRG